MNQYLDVTEDAVELGLELREKAVDLFKAEVERPEMMVTTLSKIKSDEKENSHTASKRLPVLDSQWLGKLSNVGLNFLLSYYQKSPLIHDLEITGRGLCISNIHGTATALVGPSERFSGANGKLPSCS